MSAAVPVTTGDDIDVPDIDAYAPFGTVERTLRPRAVISGLTRPSRVGPRELNEAMNLNESVAPTVRTFFALAMSPTEPNGT
jgi:hypothetical protein